MKNGIKVILIERQEVLQLCAERKGGQAEKLPR